jgi:hypothetical protein
LICRRDIADQKPMLVWAVPHNRYTAGDYVIEASTDICATKDLESALIDKLPPGEIVTVRASSPLLTAPKWADTPSEHEANAVL